MGTENTTHRTELKAKERDRFTNGFRELSDWLDAHPEVPTPHYYQDGKVYIFIFGEDQRAKVATIARAMGRAEKQVDDKHYIVSRQFAGLTLIAQADREEVCEKVVLGTREVTKEVPDPTALAAVPKVTVTETVEDVEWVCHPILDAAVSQ